jgi:hypothetical protein
MTRKIPTSTISITSLGFTTAIAAETMMIPPVHEVKEVKKRKMASWGARKVMGATCLWVK